VRTTRQRHGALAEEIAVAWLRQFGWRIVARNVRVAKDEIDIVAIEPGAQPHVVCVEVRSARSTRFGSPEERVTARKVSNLYRAARALSRSEAAGHLEVGGLPVRVDLLVVDLREAPPQIRHFRSLEPA